MRHLPTMGGSRFAAARRNDPDVAEFLLAQEEADGDGGVPYRPPDDEWTLPVELLAQVVDRLGEIAVIADRPVPKGFKRRKPPPRTVRPARAIDRARRRRRELYVAGLDDEVAAAQERWRRMQAAQPAEPEEPEPQPDAGAPMWVRRLAITDDD